MQQLPIAMGFYKSDSLPLAAQRCVNWEPVVPESGALDQRALFDVYGIKTADLTGISGVNRGAETMSGVPYFINGTTLYSFTAAGNVTAHGTIAGTSRVSTANDGQYLVIVVPGGVAYSFDSTSNTLSKIIDPNFRTSNSVVYKDGYFVFTASDGSVFFNSSLTRPLTFDALDFGSAEINPDRIVTAHVNHNELFICGEDTIELFQNVGGVGFPFVRIPGANIQKGVHAQHTTVEFDNTFLFVGGGKNELSAVWKVASSANAQKVSTAAIDSAIQLFTKEEIANAFAFSYAIRGNYFAAFTFESTRIPSKTFVYDATTSALTESSEWHERQSGTSEDRWCVQSMIKAYGKMYVGHSADGRIGYLDKDTHTEYGETIYRERASQPFSSNGLPLFVGELRLTMESGVGVITGQGSAPIIRYDYSDNGARTFSSEQARSYGKTGEYEIIPAWRRQGRIPRHRVVRFKTSEPVQSNILMMEGNFIEGVQ